MPQSYLQEDDHVAEDGVASRISGAIIKLGRAFTALATVALAFGSGGWFAFAASVLAFGHLTKVIGSFANGQKMRGLKELIRGAAETAYSFYLPNMFGYATSGMGNVDYYLYKPLHVLAEPIAVSLTGKTITGNIGEIVGNALDGFTDSRKRAAAQQQRVQPVQAAGYGVQPQLYQQVSAPVQQMQQPVVIQQPVQQYVGAIPQYAAGIVGSVPASVSAGSASPMVYNQPVIIQTPTGFGVAPQGGSWTQYVNNGRGAMILPVPPEPAGQPGRMQPTLTAGYAGAVEQAKAAAEQSNNLQAPA